MALILNTLIENNPWQNFNTTKEIAIVKYGSLCDKYHYPLVLWTNIPQSFHGIRYEMINIETKVKKKFSNLNVFLKEHYKTLPWDDYIPIETEINLDNYATVVEWTPETGYNSTKKPAIFIPIELVKFRYDNDHLNRLKFVSDNVQIGDFVKCSGTRSGGWNKVEHINKNRLTIFGTKYTKPKNDYMETIASENGMSKIVKIVRNEIYILGKNDGN